MGQIYAVFFTDGVLKVGRSKSAKGRIAVHSSAAKVRGAKVKEWYSVDVLYEESAAECELIRYADSISKEKISYEWFLGVPECLESSGIKRVMDLISEKYSDKDVLEKKIAKRKEAGVESAFDALYQKPDHEWDYAVRASGVIEFLYKGWGFHGLSFEEFNGKPSLFRIRCALYLYKRTDKFDDVFNDVFFDEYEAFNSIMTEPLEVDGEVYGLGIDQ